MKVVQGLWTIEKLAGLRDKINLNPAWQRGPAWRDARRVLLIDSILRSMDVPKIYLRRLPAGGIHSYEAVDGQQRLRAIWEFLAPRSHADKSKAFPLRHSPALGPVDGHEIADKSFAQLPADLKKRVMAFRVGVGEIVESTNDEITVLFARLQMGMPLNPAELRNADLGHMRHIIHLMAQSHPFFANTRMKDERNKHFDFASYAFSTAVGIGVRDMKSTDLRELQRDYNARPMEDVLALSKIVGDAMNVLAEVDQLTRYPIVRKWIFVDLLGLIIKLQSEAKVIDITRFTAAYDAFEERRRAYTSRPDELLDKARVDARPSDRSLYAYLFAFRTEGAKAASLRDRQNAMQPFFKNVEIR